MAAGAVAVVRLADPPRWLLLESPKSATRVPKPDREELGLNPDLSRLPADVRDLIRHGNRDEYPSRSEADWAVCLAMFEAGYGLDEIWMVMTNPDNGISGKYFEKDTWGEDYLDLTVSNAHEYWKLRRGGRGRTYARRKRRIYID